MRVSNRQRRSPPKGYPRRPGRIYREYQIRKKLSRRLDFQMGIYRYQAEVFEEVQRESTEREARL